MVHYSLRKVNCNKNYFSETGMSEIKHKKIIKEMYAHFMKRIYSSR